jgi:Protein of unknown function (DUF2840)
MIVAMLKQKGARGKTKPAVHFATDLARKGSAPELSSPRPFAASASPKRSGRYPTAASEAHRQYRSAAVTAPVTEVELVFYEGRIEHWLRFGNQGRERILDRRRRVVAFAPGEIFAFVRWEGNDYGTVLSRLDILRACDAGEGINTLPGVTPGGEILLRLDGWPRVSAPSTPLPISRPEASIPQRSRRTGGGTCTTGSPATCRTGLTRAVSMQPGSTAAD